MSQFINKISTFGDSDHIFNTIYTNNVSDGTNNITISDLTSDNISHDAMPSDIYETITCANNYDVYTAPADGYIVLSAYINSWSMVGLSVNIKPVSENNTYNPGTYVGPPAGNGYQGVSQAVKKGDKVYIVAANNYAGITRRFYYTIGAAKALNLM